MHTHEKLTCRPDHLVGWWAIDADSFERFQEQALAALSEGKLEILSEKSAEITAEQQQHPYQVDQSGIAHFDVSGPITKYPSSMQSLFGGTSSVLFERALRKAKADPDVKGAMLHIDSPGGLSKCGADMASCIRGFEKPISSHINGLGTSLAYRIAIETDHISMDPASMTGSVGTMMQLKDTSEIFKRAGVKVHHIATGDRKTIGAPGTVITEEQVAEMRQLAKEVGASFGEAVRNRRPKISDENMSDILRAGLYAAPKAYAMGMVDSVSDTDTAITRFKQTLSTGGIVRALPAVTNTGAANLQRSHMLTPEQLTQAKALPGCGDISAENADGKLLAAAMSLQNVANDATTKNTSLTERVASLEGELSTAKSALPKQIDKEVLSLVAMAAATERDAAVDAQSLTPATAAELSSLLIGDPDKEQFNASALASTNGKPLAVSVFGALRRNGRMPDVNKDAPTQVAPKAIPGAPTLEKPITPERKRELLAMSGATVSD